MYRALAASITDKLVADVGDYYDGEREGDDRRNEHVYKKRPATSTGIGGKGIGNSYGIRGYRIYNLSNPLPYSSRLSNLFMIPAM